MNRVDDIVLFKPLQREEVRRIVRLQAELLRKRLVDRGMSLTITDAAADFIADASYDPSFGARPVKRYLQHEVETRVGRKIIAGDITEGDQVIIDTDASGLTVRVARAAQSETKPSGTASVV
ncbi:MAG: hypothetical protein R3B46_00955 [Phycisphaerales bacterium]